MSDSVVIGCVRNFVEALVDDPGEVKLRQLSAGTKLIIEVKVADADIGKVVGRHGRTAGALKVLVEALSGKYRKNYQVEICDRPSG